MIEVQGVHKMFDLADGGTYALRDVSFDVHEGELVSLIGPSGCGKTTLLYCISGLEPLVEGRILLDGRPVEGPRSGEVGLIFQKAVLLGWRTVMDNVLLPIEVFGRSRASYASRAMELIDFVGLTGFADYLPGKLSGGMQQRAAIVRSLIFEPRVLLMDEPFGALDAQTREHMNMLLLRVWEATRKTIVFVTHDLEEAAFLSDRVVVLTARPGTVREIVDVPLPRPRTIQMRYSEDFVRLARRLRGLLDVVLSPAAIG
ncbi:MAG: ABC transporter ATP-binding protein [Actinobacteria bacterium]|jgi:NitT/TauT family transport system ATP-binding protein|nr:MAG: ABC transporter ATP-binding protein [Actinomycetota bacterium]